MKSNGSVYVLAVVVVLAAYFTYQWWFNPQRAMKRQLGELAATLSAPPGETEVARLARVASLRRYLAGDVHIRVDRSGPDITSRDALLSAIGGWTPPATGVTVAFVDVQVTLESESIGRAYFTVEATGRDPVTGQPTLDAREAKVNMEMREGAWVVTRAEPWQPSARP